MIDRRPLGHSRNARIDCCTSCSFRLEGFELDGTSVFLCRGCIADVIRESVELEDAGSQLYEGATYGEWLDVHQSHWIGVVGCPLCGARSVS